jgi:hypothetical protein
MMVYLIQRHHSRMIMIFGTYWNKSKSALHSKKCISNISISGCFKDYTKCNNISFCRTSYFNGYTKKTISK